MKIIKINNKNRNMTLDTTRGTRDMPLHSYFDYAQYESLLANHFIQSFSTSHSPDNTNQTSEAFETSEVFILHCNRKFTRRGAWHASAVQ